MELVEGVEGTGQVELALSQNIIFVYQTLRRE